MTRALILATSLAVLVAAVPAASPARAEPLAVPAAGCPEWRVKGDIDGNGFSDLVVSGRVAGVFRSHLEVIYQPSGEQVATQLKGAESVGSDVLEDLDGDGCSDLVVGRDGGIVVFWGSPEGLVATPQALAVPTGVEPGGRVAVAAGKRSWIYVLTEKPPLGKRNRAIVAYSVAADRSITAQAVLASPLPKNTTEDGDMFGAAMVAEGDSLFVGAPGAKVSGKRSAGALVVYSAKPSDPTSFASRVYSQNSRGVPGGAERDDSFAYSLAIRDGRLAIGVPREKVGKVMVAGMVHLAVWNDSTRTMKWGKAIHQNSAGVPGSNEFEDQFGWAVAVGRGITRAGSYDVVVGTRDEDVGKRSDAGAVTVVPFGGGSGIGLSQNLAAIPGGAERDDWFGHSVAVLPDSTTGGFPIRDKIVVGVPTEKIGKYANAGMVQVSGLYPVNKAAWTSYLSRLGLEESLEYGWTLSG